MSWLEIWAMLQVIGIVIPIVIIGLIVIYEIGKAALKKVRKK